MAMYVILDNKKLFEIFILNYVLSVCQLWVMYVNKDDSTGHKNGRSGFESRQAFKKT
jgi:hypothetical protein